MPDSLQDDQGNAQYYRQLGLEPGALWRDVEAAYWRFARELRGQSAMAPYNAAYEALASRGRRTGNVQSTSGPAAVVKKIKAAVARPLSKLRWTDT